MASIMADDVMYIGIDLGTFRSVMVSSDSHEEEELTVIGTPKDAIAKNFLKRDVLFGEEALKNRLALNLFRPLEKGVIKAMESGPFAGYPVVDMKVVVTDGSYHDVDSSEYAFVEAARVCFRNLFMQASPELLEPVMAVEATTPEEYMGTVSGSICQRRGRIDNMDEQGEYKVVRGMVPLSEMFGYSNAIRTMTSGRGSFSMHFERYEAVPFSIAEEVIKKRREANKIR